MGSRLWTLLSSIFDCQHNVLERHQYYGHLWGTAQLSEKDKYDLDSVNAAVAMTQIMYMQLIEASTDKKKSVKEALSRIKTSLRHPLMEGLIGSCNSVVDLYLKRAEMNGNGIADRHFLYKSKKGKEKRETICRAPTGNSDRTATTSFPIGKGALKTTCLTTPQYTDSRINIYPSKLQNLHQCLIKKNTWR